MREGFQQQLADLEGGLLHMAAQVKASLTTVVTSLEEDRLDVVQALAEEGPSLSREERRWEQVCFQLLLSQQPVARDLWHVSGALHILPHWERMQHQVVQLATLLSDLPSPLPRALREHLLGMARQVLAMVHALEGALAQQAVDGITAMDGLDDVVDNAYEALRRSLVHRLEGNGQEGALAMHVLQIGKYMERMGDHSVQLAEEVFFYVTGRYPE